MVKNSSQIYLKKGIVVNRCTALLVGLKLALSTVWGVSASIGHLTRYPEEDNFINRMYSKTCPPLPDTHKEAWRACGDIAKLPLEIQPRGSNTELWPWTFSWPFSIVYAQQERVNCPAWQRLHMHRVKLHNTISVAFHHFSRKLRLWKACGI